MSNTSINTKNSSTENKPTTDKYIKNVASGLIYHIVPDAKLKGVVSLRSKNIYTKYNLIDLKNAIVKGKFTEPNEHEVRKWIDKDRKYYEELTYRLIKRTMYTQLLIELDDELKIDFEDNKYIRGILEKSEKQFVRLIQETYLKMYNVDKNFLITFMGNIEKFITRLSGVMPHDFIFLNVALDKYFENPELFVPETIELTKIDE